MTSNQFFVDRLPAGETKFFLDGDEHFHLARVARAKPGDRIWLTDGRKKRMLTEVVSLEADKTWLLPVRLDEEDLKTELILGLGLTRPATMDMIVGKATELGVAQIFPLMTARSFRLPADKLIARKSRWERIARAALKQSKGAILPVINEAASLESILPDLEAQQKIFLDESSQAYFRDILREARPVSAILLIGPEGGWSRKEREVLTAANYQGLSLGGRILRTETAVVSALTLISHFWNW
ncbi:MAG: RsmE family RNA methyltransferase [Candidatus Aminicenantales bacterium]|nr:16S rRNA (uracil(1498)-N(3))-methyltransferase [Candidatus Saccharicenans sp.]NMC66456.1 16S rRNA (uracil(1498)-N(3))-methyltransferase [Acidobacteriota bacterium]